MKRLLLLALVVAALAPAAPAQAFDAVTWCGNDVAATDRQPDAVQATSIHVVYAYPQGAASRLAQLASPIATDLNALSQWWRAQDAGRVPRFDLYAFPGCPAGLAQLDISSVQLPQDAGAYGGADKFRRIRDDLNGAFDDQNKKYLVFYDGAVDDRTICGESPSGIRGGGPYAYSIIYVGSFCGDAIGGGNRAGIVIGHELIHNMGAMPTPGPPHACPGDTAHPCDDAADILYPTVEYGGQLMAAQLDVGRDDYYGHSGAWWDVQDSPFLERLDSPDRQPPTSPGNLTATGAADLVAVSWKASADDVGPVLYEIFRDGVYQGMQPAASFDDTVGAGETHAYTVRAIDAAGRLSPPVEIRFAAGLGIVDAAGTLVRDTVPPSPVDRVRASRTPKAVTLRWTAASDRGGLRGYQVLRNGKLVRVVRTTRFGISPKQARGRWTVRAVDRAGNVGLPAGVIVR